MDNCRVHFAQDCLQSRAENIVKLLMDTAIVGVDNIYLIILSAMVVRGVVYVVGTA